MNRFLLALFILLSVSCSNDDSPRVADLSGDWSLYRVSGGLLGVDFEFEESEVIWNFDPIDGEVLILNSVLEGDQKNIYSGLPSGLYSYELKKLEDSLILFIDGTQVGAINIVNGVLLIDSGISLDGFLTEFRRL